jgi:hypothetical protein
VTKLRVRGTSGGQVALSEEVVARSRSEEHGRSRQQRPPRGRGAWRGFPKGSPLKANLSALRRMLALQ